MTGRSGVLNGVRGTLCLSDAGDRGGATMAPPFDDMEAFTRDGIADFTPPPPPLPLLPLFRFNAEDDEGDEEAADVEFDFDFDDARFGIFACGADRAPSMASAIADLPWLLRRTESCSANSPSLLPSPPPSPSPPPPPPLPVRPSPLASMWSPGSSASIKNRVCTTGPSNVRSSSGIIVM